MIIAKAKAGIGSRCSGRTPRRTVRTDAATSAVGGERRRGFPHFGRYQSPYEAAKLLKRFNCAAEVQIGTSWHGFQPHTGKVIADGIDHTRLSVCNREGRGAAGRGVVVNVPVGAAPAFSARFP
ncbi:hypothetical protein [Streptomyces sp. NPDC056492]|uniref:hypothetical protein n=1 Tax=unclassified Streptomyces TaxID=2593676 RepID=UPI00369AE978